MFPEKRYSTISFNKGDNYYSNHEVYHRIMKEVKDFIICNEVVRLEPFSCISVMYILPVVNHKKQNYNRYPSNRFRSRYFR